MSLPEDLEAEAALLGDLINGSSGGAALEECARTLTVEDFHGAAHGQVFAALVEARARGERPSHVGLVEDLRRRGAIPKLMDEAALVHLQGAGGGGWRRAADVILDRSLRRRMIGRAQEMLAAANDLTIDAGEALETERAALAAIDSPLAARVDVETVDDFLARPKEERAPWVVPHVLRCGHRVIVVAAEGAGKSVLLRQMAMASSQGIHPFTLRAMPAVRALVVDLENPDDALHDSLALLRDRAFAVADRVSAYDPGRAWLWRRPAGIDLRRRADRLALEAVLAACRPQLVCFGPLYKSYTTGQRDSHELVAREVQATLDDLRTRYGFALVIEDHAPQSVGGHREWRPYGSSLWLRWPEVGIAANKEDQGGALVLKRWRGDRITGLSWPGRLERDRTWPWVGRWESDEWQDDEREESF